MAPSIKISVVIPAHNAADTLIETLDSVASQTRAADEIIVVNDGSTDATEEVVASHPVGARLLKQANAGTATALNHGIDAARGEFVALLDADDLWTPDKLQKQEEALESHGRNRMILGHVEAFECPSQPSEVFANLSYVKGASPGYLTGALFVRREMIAAEGKRFDTSFRTGYFIDWYRRSKSAGVEVVMLDDLVLKRRIRVNTLSQRKASTNDNLSRDFLEIARRAIQEKRQRTKAG